MQRLNKSPNAPVSTAFLLVLGLAILPFSLRVAGIPFPISPSLSGAMDAWQQISEVFAANQNPVVIADPAVNQDENSDQCSDEDAADPISQLACYAEAKKGCDTFGDISAAGTSRAIKTRRAATNRRKRLSESEQPVASIVIAGSEIKQMTLNALNALNITAERRIERTKTQQFHEEAEHFKNQKSEFLKNFDIQFQNDFSGITGPRNIAVPKNIKVTVNKMTVNKMKRPASASGQSTAQCKVFSSMLLERRRECDRAALISLPVVNVDNSEF
jgi:hypothetical protein